MSLLGHDVIFIQVRWYHGLFLPAFFSIVPKHTKWPFLTKRVIHELSEEVMNFNHFATFWFWRSAGNFWTMGRLGEGVWKTTTGMCSLLLCFLNERSLSLWSNVTSNLTNFYFLGYWMASLKWNTEWSGQETTSRGSFYSTLGTFQILVLGCATHFIYNHEELRSHSLLNLPGEIKWSKNTNRQKHEN